MRRIVACLFTGLCVLSSAPLRTVGDDIKARIAAAGDAAKWNADLVYVLDATDVLVRPNGIGTARSHKVIKILRDGAIRSQAIQVFPFDPNTNRLDLIAVRVYRADGEVVEVPLADKVEQPQAAGSIFWGTRQYLVQVPRLTVGDAVETISDMTGFNVAYLADVDARPVRGPAATPLVGPVCNRSPRPGQSPAATFPVGPVCNRSSRPVHSPAATFPDEGPELNAKGEVLKPPVPGHWHDEVHFWSGHPIIEKRYTVRVPKDKPLQYEVYNGELRTAVMLDGDQVVYSFEKKDIRPLKSEPGMEPWSNVAPKLLLATLPTWKDKGRWLCSVSEPQLEADDAIRAKVAEIIRDCETDEEKYTALNHWVAESIRYAGTSRGMCEGYTIHSSIETFHDRCGVCKDKAGMLVTLLRVAGFESYTVMTMARQRVDRVPADQFNHCVTCIRWPDGSLLLLDPTWMVKNRDNWSTLEPLQHVVFGIPEGKELSQSPYFPPEDCKAAWRAQTQIDEDNHLTGSLDFVAIGAPEGRIRRTLGGLHPDDRRDWFDDTFQRLSPNARATSVNCTGPVDFSGPLQIKCEFAADNFALGTGDRRFLALPMMQTVFGNRALYDLFDQTSPDERKYGIKLLATRLARFEETLDLPPGWKVVEMPKAVDIDGPSAGLHFELETRPGQIQYACDLVIKRWLIPPEEYANFKQVMGKFEELAGRVITCELESARAQR